ncbi:hypothetical protein KUCAC02_010612 [Chaenocephalus aceratus]|uniref:Uncharacterized protein n=1 Tax=Chaenocephalus aceratus TaxID=36190 RepID=A0ACB9VZQ8_CHAAC|nr:hypothetical protein KUCAC02_010612 [Chaenocephalus aceratus]
MICFLLYLAALGLLGGTAATNQIFTSSGEMDITSCPITYYGQKYDKVYVAFESNTFSLCFNGSYQTGIKNDCIFMSGGTADRGGLSVFTKEIPEGSGVHRLLPNLSNAGKCINIIPLKDSQQSEIQQVELGNFGSQAILAIRTHSGYTNRDVEADAQVDGVSVFKQTYQAAETNVGVITDVSGCRLAGVVYKTNTTVSDPTTCTSVMCDFSGVATVINDCGPMEQCQGDGSCGFKTMCTVTGSAVINIVGRVESVPDRCGYTLVGPSVIPGFKVLGVFQERRRKDVSFLERVILQLDSPNVQISLEQGGRVQLDEKVLKVNGSAQVVHGVELSRDHRGVTAQLSKSQYTVHVLFDGNTALIHMTAPSETAVQGLCGNSNTPLIQQKAAEHSAPGCGMEYAEAADSNINCNLTTDWCNLLKEAPFSACHEHIDPEPYMAACTHTLCKYPAVDGLKCQFLEAYVKACHLHSNVTVDRWTTKTSCPAVPRASCQDRFCSDNEFCGERHVGYPRCLCRAIFASKYKSANAYGEPTECTKKSASVAMANCLLEDKSIDYSFLHLNDEACKAEMDELTHMVTFKFNSSNTCGTVVMANNSQIIYKNTILRRNLSDSGMINRQSPVLIDFSCYYAQPEIKSLVIRLKHRAVMQEMTSGEWKYNLTMKAYSDAERNNVIQPDTDIQLDQHIWVEIETEGLDEKVVVMVMDSCWATDQPSPSGALRYDLIANGCANPADQTVKVEGNGLGTSNFFSFNSFQFTGSSANVYLHCKLELCVNQSNACAPICSEGARRRRSAFAEYEDKNPALITMAWSN